MNQAVRQALHLLTSGLMSAGAYSLPLALGVLWFARGEVAAPVLERFEAQRAVVWFPPPEPAAEDGADDGEGDELVEGPAEGAATRPAPVSAPEGDGGETDDEGGAPALGEPAPGGTLAAGRGGVGGGAGQGGGIQKPWKGRKPKSCDKPHPNIHESGDGIVEIDRSLVDHYTENLETFMSLGYSKPYDEGELKGWYISGFSCASPVHKAGFRRGDVLLSVNGKKTRSWVGVFLMYQKLKNKDQFEIQLVRKGEPVTLKFRVI